MCHRARAPSASNNLIFSVNFKPVQSLTATLWRFPLQTYFYSATAAAIVQSQLHEACSVYYFASFYVRQISCSFVPPPPSHQILATPLFWSRWMFVYTMQPVVQPVVKPVEAGCRAAWIKQAEFIQPVVSCKRSFTRSYTFSFSEIRKVGRFFWCRLGLGACMGRLSA